MALPGRALGKREGPRDIALDALAGVDALRELVCGVRIPALRGSLQAVIRPVGPDRRRQDQRQRQQRGQTLVDNAKNAIRHECPALLKLSTRV